RSLLARSLHLQDKIIAAILEAEQAILEDPASSFERIELGRCYLTLGNYEQAVEAFEGALAWDPDNFQIHHNVGHCYWLLAQEHRDAVRREHALQDATRYLSQALELFHGDPKERAAIYHSLGYLYETCRDYPRAITHFQIASRVEGVFPLVPKWRVAEAQRQHRAHAHCIAGFEEVIGLC